MIKYPDQPRLAIISTYDELCGIAAYTKALVPQLADQFDVQVFDLDQFLFRHESKKVQKLADKEIARICQAIKNFDCVSIQLEQGTFGRDAKIVYRRILKIMHAAPKLAITFHTALIDGKFGPTQFFQITRQSGLIAAWRAAESHRRDTLLGAGIYKAIARLQRSKPVSVIMHTRREARMMSTVYGVEHVYNHPLAFYDQTYSNRVHAEAQRTDFSQLAQLNEKDVVLGCFGFIGRYKGIDTAIKALRLLPNNYHLAIFGGVHPNEIKKNQPIDPFLQELMQLTSPGKLWLGATGDTGSAGVQLSLSAQELIELSATQHTEDISKRVHYMGALSDDDFARAMVICNTVLMPYMEVGQTSSGPISVAVDMRKHIIAARTRTFMQFARYHPERFSMFEVGNYVQLSQLIKAQTQLVPPVYPHPEVNTSTNAETYSKALFATR
jgi:glycosyltransferase involved in cell wall biosynthesis